MTYDFYIPATEEQTIRKMIAKYSKHISLNAEISEPYNKMFRHFVQEDGNSYITKMSHRIVEVHLEIADMNEWEVLAEYAKGELVFVGNPAEKLVFKNPEHGATYTKCDCCSHKTRKSMFVLSNKSTGEEIQIGPECAKSYGIYGLKYMHNLANELYAIFDFRYHESGDGGPWCYRGVDPHEKRCIESTKLFNMVEAFYNSVDGKWEKGGYEYGGVYVASKTRSELLNYIENNYMDVSEEPSILYNEVKKYFETAYECDEYNEFGTGMKESMVNEYVRVDNAHFVFFAIKNYLKYLKTKDLAFQINDYVHVVGKVVSETVKEGFYGPYTIYTILANNGATFLRKGAVKQDNEGNVNFYAYVEFISNNNFYLGKVTKNPKKGLNIVEAA